ncbi:MAG TPA: DUF4268 domain-containing protein [Thermomicrobiales bacterium]|nr:DUF4268 domain-containing protein [Thermomicrobiales bacterium]
MDSPNPITTFGTLRKLDLRTLWPKEAASFTPWLRNNLNLLGDAVGMDLEFQDQEAAVGPFSLDLLVREVGTDRVVIIENQVEKTDHDHLGKLIVYAAGFNAGVAIWIASSFREEHRQAIDWLNQRTDTDTQFFGVVVEAVQIDESRPACNFQLVAFPNDWQKSNVASTKATLTSVQQAYLEFFQILLDRLRTNHQFTNAKKGQAQSWYSFSAGKSGFSYGFNFVGTGRHRVELYIDSGKAAWNKFAFDWLLEQRALIESALGHPLEWERLDTKQDCRIAFYRDGAILDSDFDRTETLEWAISHLLQLKQVLGPIIPLIPAKIPKPTTSAPPLM